MMGKTHLLAGIMAGVAVYPHWSSVIVGGIAGLLSDIDKPSKFLKGEEGSYMGQALPFLSKPIGLIFGHRGMTHSIVALVFLVLILYFLVSPNVALAAGAGFASHLIGDMLTGKIQIFWPRKKFRGIQIPDSLFKPIDYSIRISLILIAIYFCCTTSILKEIVDTIPFSFK